MWAEARCLRDLLRCDMKGILSQCLRFSTISVRWVTNCALLDMPWRSWDAGRALTCAAPAGWGNFCVNITWRLFMPTNMGRCFIRGWLECPLADSQYSSPNTAVIILIIAAGSESWQIAWC